MVSGSVLALAVVLAGYLVARRRGAGRPWTVGLYAGAVVGVLALTLWSTVGVPGPSRCTVNRDLAEPFRDVVGRMNLAMFLPARPPARPHTVLVAQYGVRRWTRLWAGPRSSAVVTVDGHGLVHRAQLGEAGQRAARFAGGG